MISFPIGKYELKSPISIHLELTTACNFKCRHCYNFWRQENMRYSSISESQLRFLFKEFEDNEIMHLILTGGEPFLRYKILKKCIRMAFERGISISCNTNGSLISKTNATELHNLGLPHFLISLDSYKKEKFEFLTSSKDYNKVINGIHNAVEADIKVSTNMIISKSNIDDIYKTGELAYNLGVTKFHATRLVPPISHVYNKMFNLSEEECKFIADELVKVHNDFHIDVGTLVPFPYCFLNDSKYRIIYDHGCPAGTKMMIINSNGYTHACNHESSDYGNIFEIGLKQTWANMIKWRTGELIPQECKKCFLLDKCQAGCRMFGMSQKGSLYESDNLMKKNNLKIKTRKEKEYTLVNQGGSESYIYEKQF